MEALQTLGGMSIGAGLLLILWPLGTAIANWQMDRWGWRRPPRRPR